MFDEVCPHCGKEHDWDTLGIGGACPEPEATPVTPMPPRPMTAAEWLDAEDARVAARLEAECQARRDQARVGMEAVQRVIDGFMARLRDGNPWGAEASLDLPLPRGADQAFAQRVVDTLWKVGRFEATIDRPRHVGPGGHGEPMQVEWVCEKAWTVRVAKPRRG